MGSDKRDDDRPRRSLRHELRTPLNQIIGYAELLQEELAEAEQQRFVADVKHIEGAGRRLLELIDKLTSRASAETLNMSGIRPRTSGGLESVLTGPLPLPAETPAAKLLVVDDNELNRDMLCRRLERRGFETVAAADGKRALELLEQQRFDLVLLDVMMPGVSGLEVLTVLRGSCSRADLPVIMATARDASEDIVEALKLGANDYVTKPLDLPVVIARIETQLELKRAKDQAQVLNEQLQEAHDQIARLNDSAPGAMHDVDSWCARVCDDVARAVGALEVAAWAVEAEAATPLCETEVSAPGEQQLRRLRTRRTIEEETQTLFPALGLTGDLYGVVAVRGPNVIWGFSGRRVVETFARQLGGALELRRTREELAQAEQEQLLRREQLLEDGVELLQICPQCGHCYDQTASTCEVEGAKLTSPRALPYRIANRYRLTRVLGEGGMGMVFAARDERLRRSVALKVIRAEHLDDSRGRLRFENEARIVARIEHPGVVAVHDFGKVCEGSLYIVMERLHGRDLADLIETYGPGTPREVGLLLRQGAAALGAAHSASLVHRDIKPENIYLVPEGNLFRVKILDFGLAKEVDVDTHLTRTGALVGTPLFMSPEQAEARSSDARGDIYSFAAVAYKALLGRNLSENKSLWMVLLDIVNNDPPPVSSLLPVTPPEVDRAFAWALAKSPADRPSNVDSWVNSFVNQLEAIPPNTTGWIAAGALEECRRSVRISQELLPTASVTAATMVEGRRRKR